MPTPNYAYSRLERMYLQVQTTFGTIPNTTGTATVGNANACRHIKLTMSNEIAVYQRKDKTGSRSKTTGIKGRQYGKWTAEMSVAPNGVAGSLPDCDPILQSAFGQAATIISGSATITSSTNASPIVVTATGHGLTVGAPAFVFISGHLVNTAANGAWVVNVIDANTFSLLGSVGNGVGGNTGTASKAAAKYTLADSPIVNFAMWSFRQPATESQRVALGCVTANLDLQLGQDIATMTADGEALGVLESDQFSSATAALQGGLTAFPVEPTTPVTNGGVIAGFTGKAILNGVAMGTLRSANIKMATGGQVTKDLFGSYTPDTSEGDERNITWAGSIYEDDSTVSSGIRTLVNSKAPFDVVNILGTVPGSIVAILVRNIQLGNYTLDDSQRRYSMQLSDSPAAASSLSNKDEIIVWYA